MPKQIFFFFYYGAIGRIIRNIVLIIAFPRIILIVNVNDSRYYILITSYDEIRLTRFLRVDATSPVNVVGIVVLFGMSSINPSSFD